MGLAYVRTVNPLGEYVLMEIITLSPGSPPERPHPLPPLGIWGPTDPRPTHPIAGIPGLPGYTPGEPPLGIWGPPGPWPTPPIAGIPGLPGYNPPVGGSNPPANAVVVPAPVQDPPATPPEGMPAGSSQMVVWFGPGTKPAMAWVAPYASTGPVPTPKARRL